jgi:hypothetical protein
MAPSFFATAHCRIIRARQSPPDHQRSSDMTTTKDLTSDNLTHATPNFIYQWMRGRPGTNGMSREDGNEVDKKESP